MPTGRSRIALLVALAALAALVALPALSSGATNLGANLKGSHEVPGPGDPDAKGAVQITVKAKKRKVCFTLEYRKLDEGAIAAHIHKGDKDEAGPVKVELFAADPALPEEGSFEGCEKQVKRKLIRKLKRHPENYYVNVHSPPYPDGAIRGQLKLDQGI